ncbi:MaoC/PaaZ C-terminal domain-containing protein [Micromonospora sp. WMMA1363]|uniref:MaoC/PaaZ C-terminal domain-containing protein n=1 Tax=Micromonospora sp. WMMA1363 TaxID=3053985 RepID=UPI00259C8E45|nr:MaoC/PaaZ C-terminal domain-containing protein [Micromonospora sp. WMMA1363]MDM4719420.1 MaoC/PaaZ C-terminal domain-containing protein [Micromonospora sp. WMMA1363]
MPIDPTMAIGAELPTRDLVWDTTDVLLYHLAIGAGPADLHYVYERDLRVLPTFAVVTGTLRNTAPPVLTMPGIDADLAQALHGRQELVVHRPLPPSGRAPARSQIVEVQDKGTAAVVVTETRTTYFTSRSSVFLRGEGGFGGARGASTRVPPPDRAPDAVIHTPTSRRQALWYRLCGDRNPLHVDPAFAATAGFPRPILHGLCTYGMVGKAAVDAVLDGNPSRLAGYDARFAGVVYPGETLLTRLWREDGRLVLATSVVERDNAPALSDAVITLRDG